MSSSSEGAGKDEWVAGTHKSMQRNYKMYKGASNLGNDVGWRQAMVRWGAGFYLGSQRESGRQPGIQKLTRLSLYYS